MSIKTRSNINKKSKIPKNVIKPFKLVSLKFELSTVGELVANIVVVVVPNPFPWPFPFPLLLPLFRGLAVVAAMPAGSTVVIAGIASWTSVVIGMTGIVVAKGKVVNKFGICVVVVLPMAETTDETALEKIDLDTTVELKLVVVWTAAIVVILEAIETDVTDVAGMVVLTNTLA